MPDQTCYINLARCDNKEGGLPPALHCSAAFFMPGEYGLNGIRMRFRLTHASRKAYNHAVVWPFVSRAQQAPLPPNRVDT